MTYTIRTLPFLALVGLLIAILFASSRSASSSRKGEPVTRPPSTPPRPVFTASPDGATFRRQPGANRTAAEMDAELREVINNHKEAAFARRQQREERVVNVTAH